MFLDLFRDVVRYIILGTRSSASLKAENLFLRKQLALYLEREVKPRRADDATTRFVLALLSNLFAWREALVIVKPETLIGWHRKEFRLFWRWKSRPRGRPRLPSDLRALIVEMARSNPIWGEAVICSLLRKCPA
jgi:putative transposase